jgi:DNA modification methylase
MKTAPAPLWPADKVERRPLSSLVPAARNARTHSPEQVAQLAASIREWGWTVPVLVDEGGRLIAGHGRVLAAAELGLTSVPTMVAAGWSEAQVRAYRIADNKLAQNADWDDGLLLLELGELRGLEVDLGLLGFGAEELEALFAPPVAGLTDPDEAPEPPARPASLLGDVWLLGRHRLVCGDSTDADTVAAALNGKSAGLCLTDPPYGIGEGYDNLSDTPKALDELILRFLPLARQNSRVVLLTPGNSNQWRYPPPDWTLAWFIPAGIGRSQWGFSCWQPILAFGKDPFLATGNGCHPDALVMTEPAENSLGHPCPKPVNVWKWIMERGSVKRGDVVYDPFSGAGTTIIAAEMTGRACHAIELSPAYVDVAVRRWQDFTGEQATLDGDGRTFAAVADERLPYDADADSLGSYHDAVAAVGKRVKAGAPVPAFFLKQQQGA